MDAFPLDTSRASLQRTTRLVRPYKSLLVTRVTRQISGYDIAIGVALTRRTTPITVFLYATSAFLSLELLDPAEAVGGLYVEQYDICLGHLDIYLRLTIGSSTLQ